MRHVDISSSFKVSGFRDRARSNMIRALQLFVAFNLCVLVSLGLNAGIRIVDRQVVPAIERAIIDPISDILRSGPAE